MELFANLTWMSYSKWLLLVGACGFFIWYINRQRTAYFKIYTSFSNRDLFIEDLLITIKNYSDRLFLALIAIVMLVIGYDIYSAHSMGKSAASKDGQQQADIETIRAENDDLKEKLADLQKEQNTLKQAISSDLGDDTTSALQKLSSEYEKAFVNFYYLNKCGKASVYDAIVINSMLTGELAKIGVNSKTSLEIKNNAFNTFNQLYLNGSCDDAAIQPMVENQRNYMQAAMRALQSDFTTNANP
jgi:cell division protein FtsL